MNVNSVEIGERYGDDSGWERRVKIDRQENTVLIEIQGFEGTFGRSHLDWLIEALVKARSMVNAA